MRITKLTRKPTYTIRDISHDDALALLAVGWKIGGHSDGPRGAFDRLIHCLLEAGVKPADAKAKVEAVAMWGNCLSLSNKEK